MESRNKGKCQHNVSSAFTTNRVIDDDGDITNQSHVFFGSMTFPSVGTLVSPALQKNFAGVTFVCTCDVAPLTIW